MHVRRKLFPISERLVQLSDRIGFGGTPGAGVGATGKDQRMLITSLKSGAYATLPGMGRQRPEEWNSGCTMAKRGFLAKSDGEALSSISSRDRSSEARGTPSSSF